MSREPPATDAALQSPHSVKPYADMPHADMLLSDMSHANMPESPFPAKVSSPNTTSPFSLLSADVIQHILSFIANQPLHRAVLSTDTIRYLLPFALTCRRHYVFTTRCIYGISMLPLGFPHFKPNPGLPPFPSCLTPPSHPSLTPSAKQTSPPRLLGPFTAGVRRKISDADVYAAARHLPHLRVLSLSLQVRVTDAGMVKLPPLLPHLRELHIRGNHTITVLSIQAISRLRYLQVLDLSYCINMADECAVYIQQMPALRRLDVAYWKVTDEFVRVVASSPSLESLGMTSCPKVTSRSCAHIGRLAKKLTTLKLKACVNVDDEGIRALGGCKSLEHVDLSMIRDITDDAAAALGDPTLFPCLRTVLLSQCKQLSNIAVKSLSNNPNIACLDLAYCYFLTHDVAEHLRNFSNLQDLNLSECYNITDDTIGIVTELPCLQTLRLVHCAGLTDMTAMHISTAKNAPLHFVDVRRCSITSRGTAQLRKKCTEVCDSLSSPDHFHIP